MATARLAHVHLKVRDLDRSVAFYRQILGLRVTEVVDRIAFLSSGGEHHELALQAIGPAAPDAPRGAVGLFHVAFAVPDAAAFGEVFREVDWLGLEPVAVDYGISWALYVPDPDGNTVEIYVDRRNEPGARAAWDGSTRPLTREEILG